MRSKTTIKKLKQLKKQVKQAQSAPNKRKDKGELIRITHPAKKQRIDPQVLVPKHWAEVVDFIYQVNDEYERNFTYDDIVLIGFQHESKTAFIQMLLGADLNIVETGITTCWTLMPDANQETPNCSDDTGGYLVKFKSCFNIVLHNTPSLQDATEDEENEVLECSAPKSSFIILITEPSVANATTRLIELAKKVDPTLKRTVLMEKFDCHARITYDNTVKGLTLSNPKMQNFSLDYWSLIFSYCHAESIANLASTCKLLYNALQECFKPKAASCNLANPLTWHQMHASHLNISNGDGFDAEILWGSTTIIFDEAKQQEKLAYLLKGNEYVTHLQLNGVQFNLEILNHMKNLQELTLSDSEVFHLAKLQNLPCLRVLKFEHFHTHVEHLVTVQRFIATMPNLQVLSMSNMFAEESEYSKDFVTFLSTKLSLREIYINNCGFDTIVPLLEQLHNLEVLHCNIPKGEEQQQVLALLLKCQRMKKLFIEHDRCNSIPDSFLPQLCSLLPYTNVVELGMFNCKYLPQHMTSLSKIKHLEITLAGNVNDITHVANMANLKRLETCQYRISETLHSLIFTSFPASLKRLHLLFKQIDHSKFVSAVAQCNELEDLSLHGCVIENIYDIALKLPTSLTKLNLSLQNLSMVELLPALEVLLRRLVSLKTICLPWCEHNEQNEKYLPFLELYPAVQFYVGSTSCISLRDKLSKIMETVNLT